MTSTEPLRRGRLGLGLHKKQAEEVGAQAGDGSSGQCGGRQAGAVTVPWSDEGWERVWGWRG